MNLLEFDKDTLDNFINYECKLPSKLKSAFKFVVEKLGEQTVSKISDLTWNEGKNYDWAVLRSDSVVMLIRKFRNHFTVFCDYKSKTVEYEKDFSIFTYMTNRELLTDDESDERVDDPCIDIDASIESMLKVIKEGHSHLLSNSCAVHIPKHVVVKIGLVHKSIHSYDLLIYAAEEIGSLQDQLYSENEMWEIVKKIKVGDVVGRYKVVSTHTELIDGYYHGIGLYLDDSKSFRDIYCLTSYYLKDLLKAIEK